MLAHIGWCDGLIRDVGLVRRRRKRRIGADAELHHEGWYHPEETGIVVEMVLPQIVEPVGANRSPRTIYDHNKVSPRGRELHLKRLRCFVLEHRRAKKGAVIPLLGHRCGRARGRRGLRGCGSWSRSWRFRFRSWLSLRGLVLLGRWRFRGLLFRLAPEK